jgi:hypothetical protein
VAARLPPWDGRWSGQGLPQFHADHQLAFTFITGDTPLIAAAQAEELLTDNPFDHLSPSDIPGRSE